MLDTLKNDWHDILKSEFSAPYFDTLLQFVESEYQTHTIYPPKNDIFSAFNHTAFAQTKVIILGQDPYHGENQAHGLSFSVPEGQKIPPSLQNIFKELCTDIGCPMPSHGNLTKWADQGVLLLNTVMTVRAHEANSHKGKGWEPFTDAVIQKLDADPRPKVFVLWGGPAHKKTHLLCNPNHLILTAPHPSPLSVYRGFYGSQPFSKINAFLAQKGITPIDWTLS